MEQAIESVLSHDYPDLEYIVIDGGSTDGSGEIAKRCADRRAYRGGRQRAVTVLAGEVLDIAHGDAQVLVRPGRDRDVLLARQTHHLSGGPPFAA